MRFFRLKKAERRRRFATGRQFLQFRSIIRAFLLYTRNCSCFPLRLRGRDGGRPGALRLDGFVIARSHRASKDARLSTGYGDAAIQSRWAPHVPLDRFAVARRETGVFRHPIARDDDPGSTQMNPILSSPRPSRSSSCRRWTLTTDV